MCDTAPACITIRSRSVRQAQLVRPEPPIADLFGACDHYLLSIDGVAKSFPVLAFRCLSESPCRVLLED